LRVGIVTGAAVGFLVGGGGGGGLGGGVGAGTTSRSCALLRGLLLVLECCLTPNPIVVVVSLAATVVTEWCNNTKKNHAKSDNLCIRTPVAAVQGAPWRCCCISSNSGRGIIIRVGRLRFRPMSTPPSASTPSSPLFDELSPMLPSAWFFAFAVVLLLDTTVLADGLGDD